MAKKPSSEASKSPAAAQAKAPTRTTPGGFFPLGMLRDDIDRAFDRMFHDWPRFGALMSPDIFGEEFFGKATAIAPR
jgi:hypothetical protein